jgi:hypothetical protein
MIGRRSILQVVCLGRVKDAGGALSAAWRAIGAIEGGAGTRISGPSPSRLAGQDAVTYTIRLNSGRLLTEWQFVYQGWSYVAGLVCHPTEAETAHDLGQAALATWQWDHEAALS